MGRKGGGRAGFRGGGGERGLGIQGGGGGGGGGRVLWLRERGGGGDEWG